MKMQQQIKAVIYTALFFILSTIILVSCSKKDSTFNGTKITSCDNITCYNGGSCLDGVCHCPNGFEGDFCLSKWNENYTGNYDANDQCSIGNNYSVTITQNPSLASGISINNISKFCTNVNLIATINPDKTTINIDPQRFCDSLYISGTGTQTDAKDFINLWLTSRDSINHTSSNCSIILRKQ